MADAALDLLFGFEPGFRQLADDFFDHPLTFVKSAALAERDHEAGGFLAPVLQGMKPEMHAFEHRVAAGDAAEAAVFAGSVR